MTPKGSATVNLITAGQYFYINGNSFIFITLFEHENEFPENGLGFFWVKLSSVIVSEASVFQLFFYLSIF